MVEGYVSAEEASALLGVKRSTLYSYVSRGLIQSVEEVSGGRERQYLRADVERVRARAAARSGHGAVAAGALRWGEPVLDTAISTVTEAGPLYRGRLATELVAAGVGYEGAAEWLWGASSLEATRRWEAEGLGLDASALRAGPGEARSLLDDVTAGVMALRMADAGRYVQAPEVELARARRLILRASALAASRLEPGRCAWALEGGGVAACLGRALGVEGEAAVRALEACLVLCADHELNASSFTARVVASTGADLYACVSAGLAALSGPRHGGMTYRVEALVEDALERPDAAEAAFERLRRGEALPGFGHRLYPAGDPRTGPLLALAGELEGGRRVASAVRRVVEAMVEIGHGPPTVDFGLVTVCGALGAPPGSAAVVFGIGRMAGWVAHALEQRAQGVLLRPTARYIGP